jgi:hypothetical protein
MNPNSNSNPSLGLSIGSSDISRLHVPAHLDVQTLQLFRQFSQRPFMLIYKHLLYSLLTPMRARYRASCTTPPNQPTQSLR